jgi:4-hydroxy-3-polyprenylbenzoate decarboxylase
MGTGQLSLTKVIVLVDEDVDSRDRAAVFTAIARHFDPAEDFLLLPGVPLDTLDFTSFTMNLGSKMVLDAQSKPGRAAAAPVAAVPDPRAFDEAIVSHRLAWGGMLVVQVRGPVGGEGAGAPRAPAHPAERAPDGVGAAGTPGRAAIERLVGRTEYAAVKLIVAVSADVPLDDDQLLLWGIFTRFDCARDVVPAATETRGAWLACRGPLGIDATWKPGYPDPVESPDAIVSAVDAWWAP